MLSGGGGTRRDHEASTSAKKCKQLRKVKSGRNMVFSRKNMPIGYPMITLKIYVQVMLYELRRL